MWLRAFLAGGIVKRSFHIVCKKRAFLLYASARDILDHASSWIPCCKIHICNFYLRYVPLSDILDAKIV